MLFTSIRVQNYRSIADSGPLVLGPVTVVIGRNNAGKSSLLRAATLIQSGMPFQPDDVRLGQHTGRVRPKPTEWTWGRVRGLPTPPPPIEGRTYEVVFDRDGNLSGRVSWNNGEAENYSPLFSLRRQESAVAPILSDRRVTAYHEVVNRLNSETVTISDETLTSRLHELIAGEHEESRRFREMRDRVLGEPVGVFSTAKGLAPGMAISADDRVELTRMGAGVSGVLHLLAELASDAPRLFCVEEPENDLHPDALRAVLQVMVESVERGNQLLVTTHSDFVLRTLGAVSDSIVYQVTKTIDEGGIPTSTFQLLRSGSDRRAALEHLGYGDGAAPGWLILEEATMQTFLQRYIIPQFAPGLASLRLVSAAGVDRVEPVVDDFIRLALFAHLTDDDKRMWALVDHDPPGQNAVARLIAKYPTWNGDKHFLTHGRENLEHCYPAHLRPSQPPSSSTDKMAALNAVLEWAHLNPDEGRQQIGESASSLIERLKDIESQLESLPFLPVPV